MDTYKKFSKHLVLLFLLVQIFGCEEKIETIDQVRTGADILISEKLDLVKNKNLGIVTNHTAILSNGVHLVDSLHKIPEIKINALFGPEHGIRGDAADGSIIEDGKDVKTGIPVFSLYGRIRKPTPEMLENIDLLIFDIQDVGARFYTFISTMYYAIQTASENNIPILILDRPNPINGIDVSGPMLDTNFTSFVGITILPIQHGMTVGELALYFNQPQILRTKRPANLEVIKMQNWKREYYYDDCKLKWISPSPNMPNLSTAIVYPGLCLIEGINISEGRGTYSPFLMIGSPYINSSDVIKEISKADLDGFTLKDTIFTPVEIPKMALSPKYENELCNGIFISVTDRKTFKPIELVVNLIYTFHKLYPQNFTFRESAIDRLWGSDNFRKDIIERKTPNEIVGSYQKELNKFIDTRKEFLLY
ncbi:MAG: DUF1343 domain-containing protein [Ignavibacteriales bacterium]|nr:DUF1343 domain-containing protein [Ignavibacteriales bacterium]